MPWEEDRDDFKRRMEMIEKLLGRKRKKDWDDIEVEWIPPPPPKKQEPPVEMLQTEIAHLKALNATLASKAAGAAEEIDNLKKENAALKEKIRELEELSLF